MPVAARKPCARPGCLALLDPGVRYCKQHTVEYEHRRKSSTARGYEHRRKSSTARGYGYHWQAKVRPTFLAAHPLCHVCETVELVEPATEVDHIIPKKRGGTDVWDNLQGLCRPCHSRKTRSE